MTPEVPLVPDLLWEGLLLLSHQLGMGLPWTSLQHLIQERPRGIDRSRMGKKMDPTGRCRLHSTSCPARQLLHQKGPSSSTRPSPGEQPEPLWWTLATEKCRTRCPGWINLPSQTLWHPQHRSMTSNSLMRTVLSCIDNSWRSTTLPAADSATSNCLVGGSWIRCGLEMSTNEYWKKSDNGIVPCHEFSGDVFISIKV